MKSVLASFRVSATALLRWIIYFLDVSIPKDGSVVLRPFPSVEDMSLGLWEALDAAQRNRVVWLVDEHPYSTLLLPVEARSYRALSIKGLWRLFRASTVLHTHGVMLSSRFSKRKTFVNLWHGMPIKRLDPGSRVGQYQTHLTVATSEVHAEHLREAWGDNLRVEITGLPRNDRLFNHIEVSALLPRAAEKALVVWLPTYRRSHAGHIRSDGRDMGNPFQLPNTSIADVAALAQELNAHIVVKSHPMARRHDGYGDEHLTIWDDAALARAGLTLYGLLAQSDILITDHSSVWVDYLLLNRPMIFAIADLEEYERSRGFYFPDIPALLPGPVVSDINDLRSALVGALNRDEHAGKRARACALHHRHTDASSGSRVANLVPRLNP